MILSQRVVRRSFLTAVMLCSTAVTGRVAEAAVPFFGSGTSAAGRPVAFQATLSISGTFLDVRLDNLSPVPSKFAADLLSSFYFDVVRSGSIRPALTYVSGTGQVYQWRSGTTDRAVVYQSGSFTSGLGPSNLVATAPGDKTWQLRAMDPSLPPKEGFGIGTVGNTLLSPNGFDPQIVGPPGNGQIAFSIYTGADIEPGSQQLDFQYFVRDTATFRFGGLAGFTEADIGPDATFGLGTAPDSIIELPEPGGVAIAASGAILAAGWWRVRHRRRRAGR